MIAAAAVALALTQADPAPSPSSPNGLVVGAPVKWSLDSRTPTPDGFYPDPAARSGKDGQVTIACQLADSQKIKACVKLSEDPAGQHFLDADMAIARQMIIAPSESLMAGDWVLLAAKFAHPHILLDVKRLVRPPSPPAP